MGQTCFYGVKVNGGRTISAKDVRQNKLKATRFSSLTPKLLVHIPALAEAADVRNRLEILPMHPVLGIDRQIPIKCLEEALSRIQLDTPGMVFMAFASEEFVRKEGRPHTLAELLPYLRESIKTFGESPVQKAFSYSSEGTRSVRVYLETLFHYRGAKPLSLHFDCFIKRNGEIGRIRLSFLLGEIVDENSPEGFEKYKN